MRVALKHDPFGFHDPQAPVEHRFLHLEFRDAVPQQPANAVGPLEHGDQMPGTVQLLRRGQARRPRTDDCHPLARPSRRGLGNDPPFGECPFDDRILDILNGDRRLVDAQHTGFFTRGRAEAPGEFREIIGCVQPLDRLFPASTEHQVVPVGDDISQRASRVAERHAAIHAARALFHQLEFRKRLIHLVPVVQTLVDGAARRSFPLVFHESGRLPHKTIPRHSVVSIDRLTVLPRPA
jgi:hypothetical protein